MRKFILTSTIVVLLSVVVRDATGAVHYTVTDLGIVGDDSSETSYALHINAGGQVVGVDNGGGLGLFFIYSNGTMRGLDAYFPGGLGAINASGQVVGAESAGRGQPPHAVIWDNGTRTDLGTLSAPYYVSFAYGINDGGQVVGESAPNSGPGHAVLWKNGTITDLGTLAAYDSSVACAINSSGQVVGSSGLSSGAEHAVLWKNGTITDLGTLAGYDRSAACAINSSGQVVGDSVNTSPGGCSHAVLWNGGTITDLGTLAGYDSSAAYGINDSGQVVGVSYVAETGVGRAFIYSDGTMTDLNALVVSPPGWTLDDAEGINDSGQIVGSGMNPTGQYRAFILTPTGVPEPSTLLLLGAGAVGLVGYRSLRGRNR